MLLSLIRHGEMAGEPFCRPARPVSGCLSDKGQRQAQATAAALREIRYDHVLSSPYGRALQTAEIVFAGRGIPIDTLPGLHEWLPDPQGAAAEATAIPVQDRLYAEDTWKTPAGEGCFDMYARVVPPLYQALGQLGVQRRHGGFVAAPGAEDKQLAIVAHGGSLNVALSAILGLPPFPVGAFSFGLAGVAHLRFTRFRDVWYPALQLPGPEVA